MSYECPEYMYPDVNIHPLVYTHHAGEENRSKNCKCKWAFRGRGLGAGKLTVLLCETTAGHLNDQSNYFKTRTE